MTLVGISAKEYALCLVSCIYKSYYDDETDEDGLYGKMPHRVNYYFPRVFRESIGNAQIHVNRILRPCIDRLNLYYHSEEAPIFLRYESLIQQYYNEFIALSDGLSTMDKLLILCVMALEINLFCFKQDCYVLTQKLPLGLGKILSEAVEFNDLFIVRSLEAQEVGNVGYIDLKQYCRELLENELTGGFEIYENLAKEFFRKDKRNLSVVRGASPRPDSTDFCFMCKCKEKKCHLELKWFIYDLNVNYPTQNRLSQCNVS